MSAVTDEARQHQLYRALDALRDLRGRLDAAERARTEPIAIVGMGCRFPGAGSPEDFWELLRRGGDAIAETPADRWSVDELYDPEPDASGKVATRWGGFLADIDQFDAGFFGIAPREAVQMDPQQRLILEVAYETLESAGQPLERLAGSLTGVFLGVHSHSSDYFLLQASTGQLDSYSGPGSSHSVLAGRLSYLLDLHGPSLAIDTACSSSLVALHYACQSLRAHESDLALAGGVNLILDPTFTIAASRMHMLAADGRCKAFDARADGFVRGEGCGLVLLRRLSDALANGDRILSVIRGSAVNQDGHTNGLTAPNGLSQQRVIRQALANAGVKPGDLAYVETHGTGTALGDPIEIEALSAVLGPPERAGQRCYLGSAKTNIGHLEGAAGIAGVIKTVLSLRHRLIPPLVHFQTLNPHLTLAGTPLVIPTETCPWPEGARPRRAGVSAFGWSGTNAHLILEEAPALGHEAPPVPEHERPIVLPLSARDPQALRDLATRYRAFLSAPGAAASDMADIAYSAGVRRTHHPHRLAVLGRSRAELATALEDWLAAAPDEAAGGRAGPPEPESPGGLVFVFPGQGSQWLGMGRDALAQQPAFRTAIEECDHAFSRYVDWSLLEELSADETTSRLDRIDVVQPVLFAIQVGLARVLTAWGVQPDAVVGHSMGEVAAAHVAGILTLDDAARIICVRSRLLRRVSGQGAMAVVGLPSRRVQDALAGREARLAVAATNSLDSTVISGNPDALEEILAELREQNVFCRPVTVDVASHSPQMDPLLDDLRQLLAPVQPGHATMGFYSTVLGRKIEREEAADLLGPDYWTRNLRQPVLFSVAVQALIEAGCANFLELSPHPILTTPLAQMLDELGTPGQALAAVRRGDAGLDTLIETVGALYRAGYPIDWARLAPAAGRFVDLPRYPWQHRSYWLDAPDDRFVPAGHGAARRRPRPDNADNGPACRQYEVEWHAQPPTEDRARQGSSADSWLILADRTGVGAALASQLAERGANVHLVFAGRAYARLGKGSFALDPGAAADYERLLADLRDEETGAVRRIVHLWSLDSRLPPQPTGTDVVAAQTASCGSVLTLVHVLARQEWSQPPRLTLVTRGAQPAGSGHEVLSIEQAPIWGMGRVIATEHAELWGGLIDLDRAGETGAVAHLRDELLGGAPEQVALRSGRRFVARLVPGGVGSAARPVFRADGTYLVTGGMGDLGLLLGSWLVENGARHLLLVGRRGPAERAATLIEALQARGAQVVTRRCDVSDVTAVAEMLGTLDDEHQPLRGVFHAAGILEDGVLTSLDWGAFERVMAAKIAGAWNLHRLTRSIPLEHFVLFSSAATLLGTAGQANYAAANAYLDALAHERRRLGLPALSVNWGRWGDVGLATRADRAERLAERGILAIPPANALTSLGALLGQRATQAAVLKMDWATFIAQLPQTSRSLFDKVVRARVDDRAERSDDAASDVVVRLTRAPAADRVQLLTDEIVRQVASILRYSDETPLDARQGFFTIGMDSLTALELRRRLQSRFDLVLPATAVFNHPTAAALAGYLAGRLFETAPGQNAPGDDALGVHPPTDRSCEPSADDVKQLSADELRTLLDREIDSLDFGLRA